MGESKQDNELTRKDFLRYILIAAGISAMGGGAYFFQKREILVQPLTVDSFQDQFLDLQESFKIIGDKYLKMNPQGIPKTDLLNKINDKLSSDTINKNVFTDLTDMVRQQILLDFEESNLVNIQGWVTTKTEAQICALFAI